MYRHWWLFVPILAAVLGTPSLTRAAGKNVVLFVTDDQGQDAGCYGNPVLQTPNLDALAADGTRFDYAFCTTASCSASRSVILTGWYNHANGHYGHAHAYHKFSAYPYIKSLPVILGAAGYRTARVGKYHVLPEEVFEFDYALPGNSRSPIEMADSCVEFLEADDERPFFLYFCTSDPHRGGGFAEEIEHHPDRFGNLPPGRKGYKGIEEVVYDPDDVIVPPFLPDTPVCRAELAQYYQSVSRIDQGLGHLVDILKNAGHWDDTLFLYISDHGIAFPGGKTTVYEPGLRSPCIVRNPAMVEQERGNVSEAMVSWVDITPTILDWAGCLNEEGNVKVEYASMPPTPKERREGVRGRQPYPMQGRSFLEVMGEQDPEGWDDIYASHTFHEITMYYPMRVVRGRKFKLIWNIAHPLPYPFASDLWAAPTWQDRYKRGPDTLYGKRTVDAYMHRPEFELYDLENDPHEVQNLADQTGYADVLAEMKAELKEFQQRSQDPWALKWEYE